MARHALPDNWRELLNQLPDNAGTQAVCLALSMSKSSLHRTRKRDRHFDAVCNKKILAQSLASSREHRVEKVTPTLPHNWRELLDAMPQRKGLMTAVKILNLTVGQLTSMRRLNDELDQIIESKLKFTKRSTKFVRLIFRREQSLTEKLEIIINSPTAEFQTLISDVALASVAREALREIEVLRAERRRLVCQINGQRQDQFLTRKPRGNGPHASNGGKGNQHFMPP